MNAKQSIAAVVLLVGGTVSAGFLFRDRIEQDIRTRVTETLRKGDQQRRFDDVTVADVDYLDVALGGSVAQENDRFDVKNVVKAVRGVADVTTDQIVIQEKVVTPLTEPALSDPKPSDATGDLEPDLFDELDGLNTTGAGQNSDALVNDLVLPANLDDSLTEDVNEPTGVLRLNWSRRVNSLMPSRRSFLQRSIKWLNRMQSC